MMNQQSKEDFANRVADEPNLSGANFDLRNVDV